MWLAHLSTGCEVGKTSTPTQQNWAKTSAAWRVER